MKACSWPGDNLMMQQYHDNEWCVLSYDDTYIFEMLSLEGAQAGLSWSIVLSKRDEYRRAFHNFDIEYCSRLTDEEIENIRQEFNVVKNLSKLKSVRSNAEAVIKVREEFGSFSSFLWRYVDFKPVINAWEPNTPMPAQTDLSVKLSKDLKKRGFKFVGPVIMYSFLQAIGMVDDHVKTCPYHSYNR